MPGILRHSDMTENDQSRLLPRAYYSAPMSVFLASTPETVLGFLAANSEMAVEPPQAPSLGCFRLRLRLETRRGYGADKSATRGGMHGFRRSRFSVIHSEVSTGLCCLP
jgi:hypothetical protein